MMGTPLQSPPRRARRSCCTTALMMLLTLLAIASWAVLASSLKEEEAVPHARLLLADGMADAQRARINNYCKNHNELLKCPVCAQPEFTAAIQDVMAAQQLLLSDRKRGAKKKISAARKRTANCLLTAASIENPLICEELLSMMAKADRALEDVEQPLLSRPATSLNTYPLESNGYHPLKNADGHSSAMDVDGVLSWGPSLDSSTGSALQHQQANQQEQLDVNRIPDWEARKFLAFSRGGSFYYAPSENYTPSLLAGVQEGLGDMEASCSGLEADGTVCQFSGCAQGKNLVWCAIGFAKGVLGGYNGIQYVVTSEYDQVDNPPYGTLRHGLNLARGNPGGVWIIFSRDMTINLRGMLWVHSHTTIDGRNYNVAIRQHRVAVREAKQVILENLHVNSVPGGDTVHIYGYCSKVWVDHVTSYGGDLGLVSVVQGSTDVTISNCRLSNPNFNMLLGASDQDSQDQNMRVSVYRNHFFDSMQRMPHCRWGICHVANNLYQNWGYYAIGARVNAKVKSEYNVFVPSRVGEVTPWHPGATSWNFDFSARIESKGDILVNGATFHQFLSAGHDVRPPYSSGAYPPLISADRVWNLVANCAGARTSGTMHSCWGAAAA